MKIFNFVFIGFSFFTTLSELVVKLLVCIPPIFRFVQLLIIIIYTFSVIAIEIMNPDSYTEDQISQLAQYSKIQNYNTQTLQDISFY